MDPLSELKLLKRAVPEYLYHYTSIDGLHGIVKNRSIWATTIHYLNDAAELKTAISICQEILTKELRQTSEPAMKDVVENWSEALELFKATHVCVASFTEQPDLLSQWRAYCPPEGGYAIGFRTALLEVCLEEQGFFLVPCAYDYSVQADILRHWVGEIINALKIISQQINPTLMSDAEIEAKIGQMDKLLGERFEKQFHQIAPVFKHAKFSEEEEWRAISSPDPQLHFRVGRAMLVPYYKIDLRTPKFPVEEFIVGPGPHQELAGNSLGKFLESEGIGCWIQPPPPKDPNALVAVNGHAIKFSEIPYRQL